MVSGYDFTVDFLQIEADGNFLNQDIFNDKDTFHTSGHIHQDNDQIRSNEVRSSLH